MMSMNFLPSVQPAAPAVSLARPSEGQSPASQEDGTAVEFQLALGLALDGRQPVKSDLPHEEGPETSGEPAEPEAAETGGLSEAAGAVVAEYVAESAILTAAGAGPEVEGTARRTWNAPWTPSMPTPQAGTEADAGPQPTSLTGRTAAQESRSAKPLSSSGVSLPVIFSALAKESPPMLDLQGGAGPRASSAAANAIPPAAANAVSEAVAADQAPPQGVTRLLWGQVEILASTAANAEAIVTDAAGGETVQPQPVHDSGSPPLPAPGNLLGAAPESDPAKAQVDSVVAGSPRVFLPKLIELAAVRVASILRATGGDPPAETAVSSPRTSPEDRGATVPGQTRIARVLAAYGGATVGGRPGGVTVPVEPLVDWAMLDTPRAPDPRAHSGESGSSATPNAQSGTRDGVSAPAKIDPASPAMRALRAMQVQTFLVASRAPAAESPSSAGQWLEGSIRSASPRPLVNSVGPLPAGAVRETPAKAAAAPAADPSPAGAATADRPARPAAESVNPLPPAVATPAKPAATAAPTTRGSAAPASSPDLPAQQAQPSGQVTVQFRGEDGTEGQLRVFIRGATLRATIQTADAETALRLNHEIGEIQRALTGKGFTEAQILVQQPRAADEPGAAHRQHASQDQASTDREKDRRPQGREDRDPEPAPDDRGRDTRRRKEDR